MPHARSARRSAVVVATLALGAALLTGGCKTHETAYLFTQTEGITELTHRGVRVGRVEAVVVGAREAKDGAPPLIDVRLRVARAGAEVVSIDPSDLEIVTSDHQRLRVRESKTRGPHVAAAGGAVTWDLAFAIERPATLGSVDFTRMDLALPVTLGDERRVLAVTFRRDLPVHPWMDPWERAPLTKP